MLLANPKVFQSVGVDLPDDSTWTWDQLKEIGAEVTAKGGDGVFGMTSMFSNDAYFGAFLRQDGKELFTERGLGFTAADAAP